VEYLVAQPPENEVIWYFAFCEQEENPYPVVGRFLKPGFGHVVVFTKSGLFATSIEPSRTAIRVNTFFNTENANFPVNIDEIVELFKKNGFKVVRHRYCIDDESSILCLSNVWPSCVNLCKSITGYRSRAQTPYQLYKSLLRDGGSQL
jgi:hypothetical protein